MAGRGRQGLLAVHITFQKAGPTKLLVYMRKHHLVWRLQEYASYLQRTTISDAFILRQSDAVRSHAFSQ